MKAKNREMQQFNDFTCVEYIRLTLFVFACTPALNEKTHFDS